MFKIGQIWENGSDVFLLSRIRPCAAEGIYELTWVDGKGFGMTFSNTNEIAVKAAGLKLLANPQVGDVWVSRTDAEDFIHITGDDKALRFSDFNGGAAIFLGENLEFHKQYKYINPMPKVGDVWSRRGDDYPVSSVKGRNVALTTPATNLTVDVATLLQGFKFVRRAKSTPLSGDELITLKGVEYRQFTVAQLRATGWTDQQILDNRLTPPVVAHSNGDFKLVDLDRLAKERVAELNAEVLRTLTKYCSADVNATLRAQLTRNTIWRSRKNRYVTLVGVTPKVVHLRDTLTDKYIGFRNHADFLRTYERVLRTGEPWRYRKIIGSIAYLKDSKVWFVDHAVRGEATPICIKEFLKSSESLIDKVFVLPTGAGKTVIMNERTKKLKLDVAAVGRAFRPVVHDWVISTPRKAGSQIASAFDPMSSCLEMEGIKVGSLWTPNKSKRVHQVLGFRTNVVILQKQEVPEPIEVSLKGFKEFYTSFTPPPVMIGRVQVVPGYTWLHKQSSEPRLIISINQHTALIQDLRTKNIYPIRAHSLVKYYKPRKVGMVPELAAPYEHPVKLNTRWKSKRSGVIRKCIATGTDGFVVLRAENNGHEFRIHKKDVLKKYDPVPDTFVFIDIDASDYNGFFTSPSTCITTVGELWRHRNSGTIKRVVKIANGKAQLENTHCSQFSWITLDRLSKDYIRNELVKAVDIALEGGFISVSGHQVDNRDLKAFCEMVLSCQPST